MGAQQPTDRTPWCPQCIQSREKNAHDGDYGEDMKEKERREETGNKRRAQKKDSGRQNATRKRQPKRSTGKHSQRAEDEGSILGKYRKGREDEGEKKPSDALSRALAAVRVQLAFRRHRALKKVDYERRKRSARRAREEAINSERRREASRVKRTQ